MRIKNSLKNTITSFVSLLVLAILGFIATKYFIKYLGIEYNGVNGTFTNIISILSITELGLGGAITYNLYKPILEKNYKRISAIMYFYKKCYRIIGIVILILSLVTSTFVQIFLKDTTLPNSYIRILFILFATNTTISYFFSFNRNLFYAYEKNYIVTLIDFIIRIIKIIVQIIALMLFKNYIIYLIISIVFTFIANFLVHLLAKKYFPEVHYDVKERDKKVEHEVINYVKSYAIIQLLSVSINFTDSIIISSFINIVVAGLYVNYNLIFSQISKVITSFFHNIGASIGNLVAENNKDKIKTVFLNLQYLCFFISSFCITCFAFMTQPFIKIWIGSEYLLDNSILLILIFNFYSTIHRQPINYFLTGNGMYKEMIKPMIVESILNLVISIVLAIKIGLMGVFIGTAISTIFGWLLTSNLINKKNGMSQKKYLIRQIAFLAYSVGLIIVLNIIFKIYLPSSLILQLVYIFIICLVIPNIINILILYKNTNITYLKDLLNKLIKKISKK